MKTLPVLLLMLFAHGPAVAQTQAPPDAVSADPIVHHVVLENEHVRVFEALASAGATSPMHSHPPFALVSLGGGRLVLTMPDGSQGVITFHPGDVHWLEGAAHSWQMVAGDAQVIGVEVKAAASGTAPNGAAPPATDAVTVDPTHHRVVLDNDHVRVFQVLAAPGATSAMHTHQPMVLISHDRARLRMRMADGSTPLFDLHPGQVVWMAGAQHGWELLSGQLEVTAVEVKAAAAPAPARRR